MNHTPTPWQAYSDADHNQAQVVLQGDGIRSVIATCYRGNLCDEHGGSHEGNAKFIVTACNTHEELVATLKEMTTILSNIQNTLTGYLTPDSTLDQDDCINAILNISDHKETLSTQRSALQLITAIEKGD